MHIMDEIILKIYSLDIQIEKKFQGKGLGLLLMNVISILTFYEIRYYHCTYTSSILYRKYHMKIR